MTLEERLEINKKQLQFLRAEMKDIQELMKVAEAEKRVIEKEMEERVQGKLWQGS